MPQRKAGARAGGKAASQTMAKSAMAGAGRRVSAGAPPPETPRAERRRSCRLAV